MTRLKLTYKHFALLLNFVLWSSGTMYGQEVVVPTDTASMLMIDSLLQRDSTYIADSLRLTPQAIQIGKHDRSDFTPDPIRAMWLGLVFPGGGQIYNRKYWKLPIFYGGFLGCMYALTWNGMMLRDYSQAYLDIMDDDPTTASYQAMLPIGYSIEGKESRFQEIFKNKKNRYRKYRDLSIFAFIGVYALSVIDAYVDAELSSFDISRDLSLRLEPVVIDTAMAIPHHRPQNSYGLQCSINF